MEGAGTAADLSQETRSGDRAWIREVRVKVVRIVRRKINGRNRFTVQLICEGYPDHKEKNEIGAGDVGIDIGPSTIAIVTPETQKAELQQFCGELKSYPKEIRRLQRKLDRQRRANNPNAFNPNGTAKSGKQQWQVSGREKETRRKLSELYRKQAAYRKSLPGNLANHVFSLGNPVKPEKLSYRAFQGRFGKSVGIRAPGKFVESLRRQAASAGEVEICEFPTRSTRLSQTCLCGNIQKKPLSQRWHTCDCGVSAQRDLVVCFARFVRRSRLAQRRPRATTMVGYGQVPAGGVEGYPPTCKGTAFAVQLRP